MREEFPRYQFSEFVGEKGQLVFRANTYEELVDQCAQAGITLPHNNAKPVAYSRPLVEEEPPHPAEQQPRKSIPVSQFENACERCGSEKVQSKKGNYYCKALCWTK